MMSDRYEQAKAAAIDLIRVYVLRGDSYQSLKESWMGSYGRGYAASIGVAGFMHCRPKRGTDALVVGELKGEPVCFEFSLRELYDELRGEGQLRMF
jgi:hypothetical protein